MSKETKQKKKKKQPRVQKTGETWDSELTDLAVAVFDSEKQNREQRLKRKNGKENTIL